MTSWIHIAGWTLLHFVWQGACVGLVAVAALWSLRSSSAQMRYVVACAALAAMLAAPIITVRRLSVASVAGARIDLMPSGTAHDGVVPAATFLLTDAPARHGVSMPSVQAGLDGILPLLVLAWIAGVAFLLVRLVGGWWQVERLHRAALATASSCWQGASERIAWRLHLRRPVHVVNSRCVDSPAALGWLKPVVLLPIAALSNLAPAQVEAILAHELAHIRRHDYVVNLLQTMAETLLFYHPAVWWVSGRIRAEREHCCDDVAVAVCGDAVEYAAALAELEARRAGTQVSFGMAAAGGASLADRLRRLLHPTPRTRPSSSALMPMALACTLMVVGSQYLPATQGPFPAQIVRAHTLPTRPPQAAAGQSTAAPAKPPAWQTAAGGAMAFEAASVKPDMAAMSPETMTSNVPLAGNWYTPTGGLFRATNYPLFYYIAFAYKMDTTQMLASRAALPNWATTSRYDIEARASGNPTKDQMRVMMQALLADRFRLALHREISQAPIFALVPVKSGQTGPRLRPYPDGIPCEPLAPTATNASARTAMVSGGFPALCGGQVTLSPSVAGRLHVGARDITIQAMADEFQPFLNGGTIYAVERPVFDRTGLTGMYDFSLEFTLADPGGVNVSSDRSGPTFLEALHDQLGLKLESATGPVEVFRLDHVEQPTAN